MEKKIKLKANKVEDWEETVSDFLSYEIESVDFINREEIYIYLKGSNWGFVIHKNGTWSRI